MSETRFQSAVSNARPRGVRVIEAYSPKLGRRLQCFGEPVFGQWIRLDADPTVQAFCEHPTGSMSPCSSHRTDAEAVATYTAHRRPLRCQTSV